MSTPDFEKMGKAFAGIAAAFEHMAQRYGTALQAFSATQFHAEFIVCHPAMFTVEQVNAAWDSLDVDRVDAPGQ